MYASASFSMKFLRSSTTGFNGPVSFSAFAMIFRIQAARVSRSRGIHRPAANVLFIGLTAVLMMLLLMFRPGNGMTFPKALLQKAPRTCGERSPMVQRLLQLLLEAPR